MLNEQVPAASHEQVPAPGGPWLSCCGGLEAQRVVALERALSDLQKDDAEPKELGPRRAAIASACRAQGAAMLAEICNASVDLQELLDDLVVRLQEQVDWDRLDEVRHD